MRAWSDPEPAGTDAAREAERQGTMDDLAAAGVDLNPTDHERLDAAGSAHEHSHPHRHSEGGEPPFTGIVGAGAVGTALGVALSRAGWPIAAVASRDPGRRERFRSLVGGTRGFSEANALLDEVELIIVAVPDDAIGPLVAGMRLYSGQAMVHTSGLLGAEVLLPALAAGSEIGSFHPLVAFADLERAVAALHGATVAVEGSDNLVALLADMAERIGGVAVRLAPGAKAAYHAAAVLAAGGIVALLDAVVELGRVAGLDEAGALAVYLPLVRQTLDNAQALGVRAALTGPFTRGDEGTLQAHLEELERHAPDVLELYRALGRRELALAEGRGSLTPEVVRRLGASLAKPA